jgi:hypothetical protein
VLLLLLFVLLPVQEGHQQQQDLLLQDQLLLQDLLLRPRLQKQLLRTAALCWASRQQLLQDC